MARSQMSLALPLTLGGPVLGIGAWVVIRDHAARAAVGVAAAPDGARIDISTS
jgi:hypothetical protein